MWYFGYSDKNCEVLSYVSCFLNHFYMSYQVNKLCQCLVWLFLLLLLPFQSFCFSMVWKAQQEVKKVKIGTAERNSVSSHCLCSWVIAWQSSEVLVHCLCWLKHQASCFPESNASRRKVEKSFVNMYWHD